MHLPHAFNLPAASQAHVGWGMHLCGRAHRAWNTAASQTNQTQADARTERSQGPIRCKEAGPNAKPTFNTHTALIQMNCSRQLDIHQHYSGK